MEGNYMIYHICGAFIDLAAVTQVRDQLDNDHYGAYNIILSMKDVTEPFVRKVNKYEPGEIQAGMQAFEHLKTDLAKVTDEQRALARQPWPFTFGGNDVNLADIRAIESVRRHVYSNQHGGRRPVLDVKFRYEVILAGAAPIKRLLENTLDVTANPLFNEQQRLLKSWIASFERVEA